MSLDVGRTFREAFEMTTSRAGLTVMGLYLVFQVANIVISNSFITSVLSAAAGTSYPLAIGMPAAVSGVLLLTLILAGSVLGIGTIRVFVNQRTGELPEEYFTQDLLMPVANLFVGGIVFSLLTGLGFLLLVIPG
ncbi:MAG: hypothetical protein ABEJ66_01075, partial [Candidatus Nanohaloarchaea archaeon]